MVVFLSLHQKKLYAKMMERLDYRLIHDHDISCLFCHFISSIIFHPRGGQPQYSGQKYSLSVDLANYMLYKMKGRQ